MNNVDNEYNWVVIIEINSLQFQLCKGLLSGVVDQKLQKLGGASKMNSFKAQLLLNKVTSANFRDPPNVKCSFTDGPSSKKIKEVYKKRQSLVKK